MKSCPFGLYHHDALQTIGLFESEAAAWAAFTERMSPEEIAQAKQDGYRVRRLVVSDEN